MELSLGEMLLIAVAIVVLFGPDKLPQIARDLGQGVRKMRGAMEDVKTEILKETDNPISEIKREIDKVKQAAQDFNPMADLDKQKFIQEDQPKVNMAENDSHEGPVSR
ncbi:twin-arginine translocase TatA/TatE family subunit [Chryseobacterium sp. SNU WT5]|uniref:Sec-independent protein translocase subunit TatA/TatB n=1 Tax=Chryseobacterium sp. SNU WT5 TaxID=2594269 RepID=UPI00117CAF95|nr:twin-arginine translocase TatA/TatE family subunit [Chryseobacterium sp. SNU WT5]QDP86306.1 twin-arginine translocase TatA/TatE family subunit [Chryseobacterium sp. SNU WT5]